MNIVGTSLSKRIVLKDEEIEPYLPDSSLVSAVNLAIFLKRPLLIKGDPGTGKNPIS